MAQHNTRTQPDRNEDRPLERRMKEFGPITYIRETSKDGSPDDISHTHILVDFDKFMKPYGYIMIAAIGMYMMVDSCGGVDQLTSLNFASTSYEIDSASYRG